LYRAKERTRQLLAANEQLQADNAKLRKQLEDANKITECKEQMSTFYYNQEIDVLNAIIKSEVDKSTVLSLS
jgi:hypothetical protein